MGCERTAGVAYPCSIKGMFTLKCCARHGARAGPMQGISSGGESLLIDMLGMMFILEACCAQGMPLY